jgi:hypothetical protein
MKKLTLILSALLLTGIANAQSNKNEVELLQSIFGMEKKAMVSDFVKVDPAKHDAFWKLYDEYEIQRKQLGINRINLLEKYANNYSSMSNETADIWMADVIKQGQSLDKLLVKYYKKVKKATDGVTALKFYHIESYILTSIRVSILEEIPFVKARK